MIAHMRKERLRTSKANKRKVETERSDNDRHRRQRQELDFTRRKETLKSGRLLVVRVNRDFIDSDA